MSTPFRPTRAERAERAAFEAFLRVPLRARHALVRRPVTVDGHTLDPDIQIGLDILGRLGGPELEELPVRAARRRLAADSWTFEGPWQEVDRRDEVVIPTPAGGMAATLLRPAGTPMGLVVYFHGGGWVLGNRFSHENVGRHICARARVAVLVVEYRLAPENPFPAAVEDALAAFDWAHEHASEFGIDPARVVVAGDSAGGNLSAVVAQQAHARGGPEPAGQALLVPVTDLGRTHGSRRSHASGYFLTQATMEWYEAHYLQGHDPHDPQASPLRADDVSGLPPAYVLVAGFDPLRDEGIEYAEEMRAAGVDVTLDVQGDAVHPIITIPGTEVGRRGMANLVAFLLRVLGSADDRNDATMREVRR